MRKTTLFLISLALLFCSCERSKPESPQGIRINWDVVDISNKTKSLISCYDELQNACTPIEDGGLGKAIGFAAARSKGVELDENAFGMKETRLIYKTKIGSPYNWNYIRRDAHGNELDDLEWDKGSIYHIRAYYPQSLTSNIEPSSNPNCLILNYSTHENQEDLLVAYNRVLTEDPKTNSPSICIAKGENDSRIESTITSEVVGAETLYGYSQSFELRNAVPLFFEHTLAAIRVRFKFDYDVSGDEVLDASDELLNCFFTNIDNENGLHTVGTLIYGNEFDNEGESREQLEGWWKTFSWRSRQSSMTGLHYYRWGLSEEDIAAGIKSGTSVSRYSRKEGGNRVVSDRMAVAYTKFPTQDCNDFTITGDPNDEANGSKSTFVDTEAGPLTMSLKEDAPYFNENDGWLFIIPQKAVSGLVFNFTTRKMGLISTIVPPLTYTYDADNDHAYLPGYRYTYTLTKAKSDFRLDLSIRPWNNIYASEEIVF